MSGSSGPGGGVPSVVASGSATRAVSGETRATAGFSLASSEAPHEAHGWARPALRWPQVGQIVTFVVLVSLGMLPCPKTGTVHSMTLPCPGSAAGGLRYTQSQAAACRVDDHHALMFDRTGEQAIRLCVSLCPRSRDHAAHSCASGRLEATVKISPLDSLFGEGENAARVWPPSHVHSVSAWPSSRTSIWYPRRHGHQGLGGGRNPAAD